MPLGFGEVSAAVAMSDGGLFLFAFFAAFLERFVHSR
jgi:hypothetical protein